jgi:NAD(P)-dependent dehydrogenase (short-subunit alcohol dehydrogenase family)
MREELGHVDILFNHVGGTVRGPMLELTDDEWEQSFRHAFTSKLYCTRTFGRIMIDQGTGGSIVNTSTVAGVMTLPNLTAFSVAAAGINQFTRCMAVELAPHRIRVNCLMLGAFENALPNLSPDFREWLLDEIPMHRFGAKDESAPAAIYLASDASSFVTRAILPVSGGVGI